MNILFITPTLPSRLSRIRAYNILKCLYRLGHRIHLLSFIDSESKKRKIEDIKDFCASIDTVLLPKYRSYFTCALNLFNSIPLRVAYYSSEKMRARIKEILRNETFDLVYIKRKRMAQYGEALRDIPKVLDLTDAVSLHYKRALETAGILRKPLYLEEYIKTLRYEIDISKKFDRTVLCSPTDLEFLKSNSSIRLDNLAFIPNNVDTEYYRPRDTSGPEPKTILFSGVMGAFVNIDAAKYLISEIFPLLKKMIPDVKLYIVGPSPSHSIRRFARDSQVIVTGYVNDLRDYIKKAEAVVCPMRIGTGFRNKICQAMAMGKPVISTSLGAEGLEVTPGKDILIADDPKEFARKTANLLEDTKLQDDLGRRGYELIKSKYSLEALEEKMSHLLKEAVR